MNRPDYESVIPPRPQPPRPALRVGEHRAVQCNDCHRIIPRAAAILYRFNSTYHCEDGADCAAAMASMAQGEVGR